MSATGGLAVLIVGAVLSSQPAAAAPASTRVYFVGGQTMDVAACRFESSRAVLTLTGGETIAFPSTRVARLEALQAPDATGEPPAQAVASPPAAPASGSPSSVTPDSPKDATAGELASSPVTPDAPALAPDRTNDIETLIKEAAAKYGLEVDLLAAVIAVESGYRLDAVSPKGAQGLMQLMPGTSRDLSVSDPFNPAQNIDAGARYLRQLLDENHGKYWRALAAYNAGAGKVARFGGVPPYRETISYIRRVLQHYGAGASVPPTGGTAVAASN